jgi:nicotinamide phosphoribosyltransferase
MRNNNIILKTDSYKLTHWKQYPDNTQNVYSYFESRVGAKFKETVFFGLQYFMKEYLEGNVITLDNIKEAKAFTDQHLGPGLFNEEGWIYVLHTYKGKLPVRICAVPEGMPVPESNVLMTIENTDPNCCWLTNYLETLLVQVWYPSTVATLSRENKKNILKYLEETGTLKLIDFKLHDFGYRGVSCDEQASLGSASHLVNFKGTDTLAGILMAQQYYNTKEMVGFSIPASEHSTITSWGKDHENDAMRNMLDKYPSGMIACVSDSWDIFNACSNIWGKELKDKVIARNGILVIRPDSGNPPYIVPKVINLLGEKFGFNINQKGYKVLHDKVRVIQGDGINYEMIPQILYAMKDERLSADNIAFGSGGGLLQHVNRDTQRFAFKCSSVIVNGEQRNVYKQPLTDNTKNSKQGRLALINDNGTITTVQSNGINNKDILQPVFENGKIIKNITFEEVRNNASI